MTDRFLGLHEEYAERMASQGFDALFRRVFRSGQCRLKDARILSRPTPWEDARNKTFGTGGQ